MVANAEECKVEVYVRLEHVCSLRHCALCFDLSSCSCCRKFVYKREREGVNAD